MRTIRFPTFEKLEAGNNGFNVTILSNANGPDGTPHFNDYDPDLRQANYQPKLWEISPEDDGENRTTYISVSPDDVFGRIILQIARSIDKPSSANPKEFTGPQAFNGSLLEPGFTSHDQGNAAREAEAILGRAQGMPGIASLETGPIPVNGSAPFFFENEQRTALIQKIDPNEVFPEYARELGIVPEYTEIQDAKSRQDNANELFALPGSGSGNTTQDAELARRISEGQGIYNDTVVGTRGTLAGLKEGLNVSFALKFYKAMVNQTAIANFGDYYGSKALPEAAAPPARSETKRASEHFMLKA